MVIQYPKSNQGTIIAGCIFSSLAFLLFGLLGNNYLSCSMMLPFVLHAWDTWHILKVPALIIDNERIYLDKGALKSKLVLSLKEIKEIEKFSLKNKILWFNFELQTGERITYRFLYEDSLFWEDIYTEINRAMNELNEKDDCRA